MKILLLDFPTFSGRGWDSVGWRAEVGLAHFSIPSEGDLMLFYKVMRRAVSRRTMWLVAVAAAMAAGWVMPTPSFAQVHFHDMVGANLMFGPWFNNNGHDVTLLMGDVIGHNRAWIRWDKIQTEDPDSTSNPDDDFHSMWNSLSILTDLRRDYGVESMVYFGFTPSWATRTTDLTWTWQGVRYERKKHAYADPSQHGGDQYYLTFDEYDLGNGHHINHRIVDIDSVMLPPGSALESAGGSVWANSAVQDWQHDWVRAVVNDMGRTEGSPANAPKRPEVEYFQPGNEAHPGSGYWFGSMKEYFQRLHLPAVEAIRKQTAARDNIGVVDKKVVYGGWIGPGKLRETGTQTPEADLPDVLNHFSTELGVNLWDSIDVLDVHYRRMVGMEELRQEMVANGYGDKGLWQTEINGVSVRRTTDGLVRDAQGNTWGDNDDWEARRDYGSVPLFYPRFAQWALRHNPERDPDKYRVFWYRYYKPQGYVGDPDSPDPRSRTVLATLVEGPQSNPTLTEHGKALETVGRLLGGGALYTYDAVASDTGLTFQLGQQESGLEAFRIEGENRLVAAVHLNAQDAAENFITLYFPELELWQMDFAKRVTPWNIHTPLTPEQAPDGGVMFVVPTAMDGPRGHGWYWESILPRTFFVNVQLYPAHPRTGYEDADGRY